NCAASSPITPSARPYIGEESITLLPCFTKSDSTSPSCVLFSGVRLTSNTLHVPSPMTGSFSPEEGVERVSILDSLFICPGEVLTGRSNLAVVPPINFAASRRVIFHCRAFLRKANGVWHRRPTTAIWQYGSPPVRQSFRRCRTCSASENDIVIRGTICKADAHS